VHLGKFFFEVAAMVGANSSERYECPRTLMFSPRSISTTRHNNPRLAQHHQPGPVNLGDVGKVQLRRFLACLVGR
jgi:hypothetical protein